jgi:hypothetical protein
MLLTRPASIARVVKPLDRARHAALLQRYGHLRPEDR